MISKLQARVAYLERSVARLRAINLTALLFVIGSVAVAWISPQQETITAQRFILVTASGDEVGSLGVDEGQGQLELLASAHSRSVFGERASHFLAKPGAVEVRGVVGESGLRGTGLTTSNQIGSVLIQGGSGVSLMDASSSDVAVLDSDGLFFGDSTGVRWATPGR